MNTAALRARYGGRWDGGGREIHGLIDCDGASLKIELLRASNWCCSIFIDGECVAQERGADAEQAVEDALTSWRR